MNSPVAVRMPVFTAAPFPLLYGCRTTRAPAAAARAPVASLDPSSTTITSCQSAAARRRATTSPIASASFIAGMTRETVEGSAKQLFDHAVPRDGAGAVAAGGAQARREARVGREPIDGGGDCRRVGGTHHAVHLVPD